MKKLLSYSAIILFFIGCSDKINLNSKNYFVPVKKVSLEFYKSPQERSDQDSKLSLGVAISGGGSRAQFFGTGVLIGLDEVSIGDNSFLREVDYFSTASGGGFAAGYFNNIFGIGLLDSSSYLNYWGSKMRLEQYMYKAASELTIVKFYSYEGNRIKKPYPDMVREELLHEGDKVLGDVTIPSLSLKDIQVPAESNMQVKYPFHVTNGTIFENGERIPIMPHILDDIGISKSLLPVEDFSDTTPSIGFGFPYAYAIASSAAFPGVLPMTRYELKSTDKKELRILDGGAADNLGYKTLFELLGSDSNPDSTKAAIIIDCSGRGIEERYSKAGKLRLKPLMKKALLWSVDVNIHEARKNIARYSHVQGLDSNNILRMGITSIREHLREKGAYSEPGIISMMQKIENGISWGDLFEKELLAKGGVLKEYADSIGSYDISALPSPKLTQLTDLDLLLIYELASNVETKIKIGNWEEDLLVLAGRVVVHINREKIFGIIPNQQSAD